MSLLLDSAINQLQDLKSGSCSAVELLDETFDHGQRLQPAINSIALPLYDRAIRQAKYADRLLRRGKGGRLCGLPITIKDSQYLAGYRCANGSQSLRDFVPQETCRAVELLEAEGAVVFAKTTCPEFSLSGITSSDIYGTTSNPWDVTRTSGGSSGGAAAAVASGIGAFSLGGDGGGSIRIPSAFCGTVGFKPSHGVVPREPCFPSWQSIVSYGPITRSVADAWMFYSILSEMPESPPLVAADLTGYPLIVSEDLGFAPVDDDVRACYRGVMQMLGDAGAVLIEDMPRLPSSVVTWAVTACYDAALHADSKQYDPALVGRPAKEFLKFGRRFNAEQFAEAQAYRDVIRDTYGQTYARNGSQILITPTLGCEAFEHGKIHPSRVGNVKIDLPWLDWAGFLYDANLAEFPACAIPMGFSDSGLPLSLQIQGPRDSDLEVLRVAAAIEKLIGWNPRAIESRLNASKSE